jgi:hypothetical protein
MDQKITEYLQTYNGKQLIAEIGDPRFAEGIWQIYSEDTSDYGGYGNSKLLDTVSGVLELVIEYAFTIKGFSYYGGGRIVPVMPTKNITRAYLNTQAALRERLEQIQREADEIEQQLRQHLD